MQYGCIGEHLSHSFSQTLHNKIGDYDYILKEIEKDKLNEFLIQKDFKGINVTIPYKVKVIPYLYEIDEKAKSIGAVNTVVNKDNHLMGYNTDFDGMKALINKLGICMENKKVLILGTGGTSKTAFAVSKSMGAKSINKVSRNKNDGAISYDEAYEIYSDTQVIINTTPCGMYPNTENMPINIEKFKCLEGVVDVIYNPLRSQLVLSAESKNIKSGGGLYMLTAQAVYAAEKFFGTKYDVEFINKVYNEIYREKLNIVLIGMPGCGKTTIGKILSKKLNKEFIDTDDLITEKIGKTPNEIIKEQGICEFRKIETQVIKELRYKNNCVISTGGGAILNSVNLINLKLNGVVYFIDRPISNILPTSDRPLSCDREKLVTLFNERYDIYKNSCDKKVDNNDTIENAVENIAYDFERII